MTPVLCVSSQPSWRVSCDIHCQHRNTECKLIPPLAAQAGCGEATILLSVLQCQCASSAGRMRVGAARTELGQLSSTENSSALISRVTFFSSPSTYELTKTRAQLNFGLTEHPQLKPVQWEDEVLAISGRKVLTLPWEFQEWEIFFVVYLCSYGYICLLFKQD